MATVETRYEPSQAGWARVFLSPQIQAACVATAAKGKAFAVAIAPRSGDAEGVPYADSFRVQPIISRRLRGSPRVGALLVNDAPHAAAVEFGNRQTPKPQRVIGRTAAFLGSAL